MKDRELENRVNVLENRLASLWRLHEVFAKATLETTDALKKQLEGTPAERIEHALVADNFTPEAAQRASKVLTKSIKELKTDG